MKQTYEDTTAIGAEGKRLVISFFKEQVSVFFCRITISRR